MFILERYSSDNEFTKVKKMQISKTKFLTLIWLSQLRKCILENLNFLDINFLELLWKKAIIYHIYLWFPACKPFYFIFLSKFCGKNFKNITTLNRIELNGKKFTWRLVEEGIRQPIFGCKFAFWPAFWMFEPVYIQI